MSKPLGQPIRLTFSTFSDAAKATPADPTTVALTVRDPAGTSTTYTWAASQVVRDSLGVFHYDITPTTAGHYTYRWVATGAVATSTPADVFDVDPALPVLLVSLEDVKAELNKTATTDDDELRTTIAAASAILLNLPQYRIADVCDVQSYTEDFAGGDTVILRHYPVAAVTSVTEYYGGTPQVIAAEPITTSAFTTYGYRLDAASGILKRLSGGYVTNWVGDVRVVYTAGSGVVPADIRGAALKLVKHLWGDQRGASSQPFDTSGDEFLPPSTAHLLPWEVAEALSAYRRDPVVA